MPYKDRTELPPEVQEKLTPAQQDAFIAAFNSAAEDGNDEESCFQIAYAAAMKVEAASSPPGYFRVVSAKKILRLGKFIARTGEFEVTAKRLSDCIFGINSRFGQQTPVGLKYTHLQGPQSVQVGFMRDAKEMVNGQAVSDLYITQDAVMDLDGKGPRTVATIDQIADGLEQNILHLSIEGNYNRKREGYYEGRTLALEPVAWAILPTDTLPAVPQVAASGEADNRPDIECIISDTQEGAEMEQIEKLQNQITALQSENTKLAKELTDLKAENERKEAEQVNKEIAAQTKEIAGKLQSGKRDEFVKRVEAKGSPEEKRAVLAEVQALMESGIIASVEPRDEVLAGGEEGAKSKNTLWHKNREARENVINEILAENEGMERVEAELIGSAKEPELWSGMPGTDKKEEDKE